MTASLPRAGESTHPTAPSIAPFDPPRAVAPRRSPQTEPATHVAALECIVNGNSILLASDAVGKIVEYEVSPLPLARAPMAGIGVLDGAIVLSLAPFSAPDTTPRRKTKGIVLRMGDGAVGTWTLEISGVVGFVDATVTAGSRSPSRPWVARATTRDARDIVWLDVADMIHAISAS